jgi:hypothetical protein
MRYLKYAALLGLLVFAVAGTAHAQVAVGVRLAWPLARLPFVLTGIIHTIRMHAPLMVITGRIGS